MNKIFEAAGSLAGLPKHWIKYLASRWWTVNPTGQGTEMAGEHSNIIPLGEFNPPKIRKALKDSNNLAVIGRVKGEPLFMITPHNHLTTQFHIFETEPSQGEYESKGYRERISRRNIRTRDNYKLDQITDIVDKMFADHDFSGLTLEAITKDPKRRELATARLKRYQEPGDPLYSPSRHYTSPAQKARAKKYGELKAGEVDKKLEKELERIKEQVNKAVDVALEEVIEKVKKGYYYSVEPSMLAREIAKRINLRNLKNIAAAYDAVNSGSYSGNRPEEMAQKFKAIGVNK